MNSDAALNGRPRAFVVAVAEASAGLLEAAMGNHAVSLCAEYDGVTDKQRLRIECRHHGNIKKSQIDPEFTHGADYAAPTRASPRS